MRIRCVNCMHQNRLIYRSNSMYRDINESGRKDTSHGLLHKVLVRISEEQLWYIKRRLVVMALGFGISIVAIIPISRLLISGLTYSESLPLFSLMFSDFSIILADWQIFLIALAESLPIATIAVFLSAVLIVLRLLAVIATNFERLKKHQRFV